MRAFDRTRGILKSETLWMHHSSTHRQILKIYPFCFASLWKHEEPWNPKLSKRIFQSTLSNKFWESFKLFCSFLFEFDKAQHWGNVFASLALPLLSLNACLCEHFSYNAGSENVLFFPRKAGGIELSSENAKTETKHCGCQNGEATTERRGAAIALLIFSQTRPTV